MQVGSLKHEAGGRSQLGWERNERGQGVGVVKIHYTLSTDKKLKTNLGRKKESLKARQ